MANSERWQISARSIDHTLGWEILCTGCRAPASAVMTTTPWAGWGEPGGAPNHGMVGFSCAGQGALSSQPALGWPPAGRGQHHPECGCTNQRMRKVSKGQVKAAVTRVPGHALRFPPPARARPVSVRPRNSPQARRTREATNGFRSAESRGRRRRHRRRAQLWPLAHKAPTRLHLTRAGSPARLRGPGPQRRRASRPTGTRAGKLRLAPTFTGGARPRHHPLHGTSGLDHSHHYSALRKGNFRHRRSPIILH